MIWTIARFSVTEHVRRKLVMFFLVILGVLTLGLIYLAITDDIAGVASTAVGLGTATSLLFLPFIATLAAIAVSMNNIGRPFSDGEAMLILSRPITRRQYALGRLAASLLVIAGLCGVTALLMQTVGLIEGQGISGNLWGHWAITAFNLGILASITTLVSGVVNAPVLAGCISYFLYSASRFVATLYLLVVNADVRGLPKVVITIAWYLTPKTLISPLLVEQANSAGSTGLPTMVLIPSAAGRAMWAVAYLLIMVGLTFWVVDRKDLRS